LMKRFKLNESSISSQSKIYYINDSIFASHPPLSYRAANILYLLFQGMNKTESDPLSDQIHYKNLLDKIKLRRVFFP
jgi:hypothetical protein